MVRVAMSRSRIAARGPREVMRLRRSGVGVFVWSSIFVIGAKVIWGSFVKCRQNLG